MPFIDGLKQTELALAEINKLLKQLEGVNKFLLAENPTSLYELRFKVKDTENADTAHPGEVHKKSKVKQYTTALFCENKEELNHFVQLYKESIIRTINQLMKEHRIRLTEEEMKILAQPVPKEKQEEWGEKDV